MISRSRIALILGLALVGGQALVACGGDDKSNSNGAGGSAGKGGSGGSSQGKGGSGGSSQGKGGSAGKGGSSAGTAGSGEGGEAGNPGSGGDGGSAGSSGAGGTAGSAGNGGNAGAGGSAGNAGTAGTSGSGGTGGSAGAGGSAGTAGTGGAGGSAGNGGTAGSAGTSGSGGSAGSGGGGPMCEDGTVTEPEICDNPFTVANCGADCMELESAACRTCVGEAGLGTFDCGLETGTAAGGPAAGTPRLELCQILLDCMYATHCAAADPVDCYCGTSGAACQTGGANGACREEIENSLESTSFGDIGARIGDPSFAGGVAVIRVDGSRMACGDICGSTN